MQRIIGILAAVGVAICAAGALAATPTPGTATTAAKPPVTTPKPTLAPAKATTAAIPKQTTATTTATTAATAAADAAAKSALAAQATPPTPLPPALTGAVGPDTIMYTSNGLMLRATLYRPAAGDGPFPTVLLNHGSEPQPNPSPGTLNFWLSRGFAVFAPIRSGQGGNPGKYIVDREQAALDQARTKKITIAAAGAQVIALHQKANEDVIAAFQWLLAQPFVDKTRVVVQGGSYGGIQTLLTAQKNAADKLGVKCFIAMSPAAESWNASYWPPFLTGVVKSLTTPVFLMQAANDYNLGPSNTLGPIIDAKGFPNRHMIFPVHGDPNNPAEGHGPFMTEPANWAADVLAYLEDCGALPQPPVIARVAAASG